jgi:hypothetical protein
MDVAFHTLAWSALLPSQKSCEQIMGVIQGLELMYKHP